MKSEAVADGPASQDRDLMKREPTRYREMVLTIFCLSNEYARGVAPLTIDHNGQLNAACTTKLGNQNNINLINSRHYSLGAGKLDWQHKHLSIAHLRFN